MAKSVLQISPNAIADRATEETLVAFFDSDTHAAIVAICERLLWQATYVKGVESAGLLLGSRAMDQLLDTERMSELVNELSAIRAELTAANGWHSSYWDWLNRGVLGSPPFVTYGAVDIITNLNAIAQRLAELSTQGAGTPDYSEIANAIEEFGAGSLIGVLNSVKSVLEPENSGMDSLKDTLLLTTGQTDATLQQIRQNITGVTDALNLFSTKWEPVDLENMEEYTQNIGIALVDMLAFFEANGLGGGGISETGELITGGIRKGAKKRGKIGNPVAVPLYGKSEWVDAYEVKCRLVQFFVLRFLDIFAIPENAVDTFETFMDRILSFLVAYLPEAAEKHAASYYIVYYALFQAINQTIVTNWYTIMDTQGDSVRRALFEGENAAESLANLKSAHPEFEVWPRFAFEEIIDQAIYDGGLVNDQDRWSEVLRETQPGACVGFNLGTMPVSLLEGTQTESGQAPGPNTWFVGASEILVPSVTDGDYEAWVIFNRQVSLQVTVQNPFTEVNGFFTDAPISISATSGQIEFLMGTIDPEFLIPNQTYAIAASAIKISSSSDFRVAVLISGVV